MAYLNWVSGNPVLAVILLIICFAGLSSIASSLRGN